MPTLTAVTPKGCTVEIVNLRIVAGEGQSGAIAYHGLLLAKWRTWREAGQSFDQALEQADDKIIRYQLQAPNDQGDGSD